MLDVITQNGCYAINRKWCNGQGVCEPARRRKFPDNDQDGKEVSAPKAAFAVKTDAADEQDTAKDNQEFKLIASDDIKPIMTEEE